MSDILGGSRTVLWQFNHTFGARHFWNEYAYLRFEVCGGRIVQQKPARGGIWGGGIILSTEMGSVEELCPLQKFLILRMEIVHSDAILNTFWISKDLMVPQQQNVLTRQIHSPC